MIKYQFDDHYVEALRLAMRRHDSRDYVLNRIGSSLYQLNINSKCVTDIISLLMNIANGVSLEELVAQFQSTWRPHLDRVYLRDYEASRWNFMSRFVFTSMNNLGRCLDVGCGRGCITANLVEKGMSPNIVGIDAADFNSEWRERESSVHRAIKFESVQVSKIEDWLQSEGQFDTILLFYVLHHSEEFWCARTLRALYGSLTPSGKLIVVEDSLFTEGAPSEDMHNLSIIWRNWVANDKVYSLTPAYNVQVVLDFVAVQLLAGFWDVRMPCNYKTSSQWEELFKDVGYKIIETKYIGFPEGRDIDVPQSLFVLGQT